jgi:hypothetical protein
MRGAIHNTKASDTTPVAASNAPCARAAPLAEQCRKDVQDLSCSPVPRAASRPRRWLRRIISNNAFVRS